MAEKDFNLTNVVKEHDERNCSCISNVDDDSKELLEKGENILEKVNNESLETLRKMLIEIDSRDSTKQDTINRKAIFRAIEVIQAYKDGNIINNNSIGFNEDFVAGRDEDLLYTIQAETRNENKLKKELDRLETLYDTSIQETRTQLMNDDRVINLKTKDERNLAVDSLLKDHVDKDLVKNIESTSKDLDDCRDELRLAEKIYRLRNIYINPML